MKKPIITLKNIKHAVFSSQETECFQASVYVNTKLFCIASNAGRGGCNDYAIKQPNNAWQFNELNQLISATYPSSKSCFTGETIKADLESVVNELLDNHLNEKHFKKIMRNILFVEKGNKAIYSLAMKATAENIEACKASKRFSESIILNDLPTDEARAYYENSK
jgi:hypothetical protein